MRLLTRFKGKIKKDKNTKKRNFLRKIMKDINSVYDQKNGLIFDRSFNEIQRTTDRIKTRKFEDSKVKPLLLLNSNQLTRAIFFHRRQLSDLKNQNGEQPKRKKRYKKLRNLVRKKIKVKNQIENNFFITGANQ